MMPLQMTDELRSCFEAVRMTVSERHWMIFQRYLIENQSSRQVAEEFGTTHFNVRVISHRIRKWVAAHRHSPISEAPHASPGILVASRSSSVVSTD